MNTKQVIAVIAGQGNMSSSFVRSLSKGNYRIVLYSWETDAIHFLVDEIKTSTPTADVEIVDDVVEACWEADIVILAVPYTVEKQLVERIRSVVNQKVIISISKPDNDRYDGLVKPGISPAEELQKQLPNAKVIKASNIMSADVLHYPTVDDQRMNCLIAGNDNEALKVVWDLVKAAGFNPVIAGDLNYEQNLEKSATSLN